MSGLRWTQRTREKISDELSTVGITVGPTTVGKILKKLHFSLKCNSKKRSNGGKKLTKEEAETRDQQFNYLAKMREEFAAKGVPVMSVDTKKKELIGNFKNPGTRYKKDADLVNDHDFAQYGIGKGFPYGLLDTERNEGFVYVGQSFWDPTAKKFSSKETPEFAADCVAKWWTDYGRKRYKNTKEILILADAGGSNSYRSTMWKFRLYQELATKCDLTVTVCHYPSGASKWNLVEHRLFSEISKNWKGTPLRTFETVLKYLRTTKTKTGLTVRARLVPKTYESGKTVPPKVFENLNIRKHDVLPKWNYTISPGPTN